MFTFQHNSQQGLMHFCYLFKSLFIHFTKILYFVVLSFLLKLLNFIPSKQALGGSNRNLSYQVRSDYMKISYPKYKNTDICNTSVINSDSYNITVLLFPILLSLCLHQFFSHISIGSNDLFVNLEYNQFSTLEFCHTEFFD